jgi:hypothetical protein
MNISFRTDSKEIKSVIEQINKQQITVGDYLQKVLLAKKEDEGKEFKTIREYMESQRSYVWETWRASNLIQSLLLGVPITEIWLYRSDDVSQFRKVLDGQQRLTSIYMFINDSFKLDLSKSIFPKFTIEGTVYTSNDFQGKTFSELPELLRDIILNYDLQVITINNCSEEMAERIFVSINVGAKAFRVAEVRKAAMGITTRRFVREIVRSDWFLHALTSVSLEAGKSGDEIVSQIITLLYNNQPIELSKENIDSIIYPFRESGLPEELKSNIINISNYLNDVTAIWIEDKKKIDASTEHKGKKVSNYATYRFAWLNKTHITMLMYAAYKAITRRVSVNDFSEWAFDFFRNPSQEYKDGTRDKAIDLKCVELRTSAIDKEIQKLKAEPQPEPTPEPQATEPESEPVVTEQETDTTNAETEVNQTEQEVAITAEPKKTSRKSKVVSLHDDFENVLPKIDDSFQESFSLSGSRYADAYENTMY